MSERLKKEALFLLGSCDDVSAEERNSIEAVLAGAEIKHQEGHDCSDVYEMWAKKKLSPCSKCGGSGLDLTIPHEVGNDGIVFCPTCKGKGSV